MRPANAEEYLESMPHESPARRAARELVGQRLNGVHWRWKQRSQQRAAKRGQKEAHLESQDDTSKTYRLEPTEPDKRHVEFFERLFQDPTFWNAYGASLNDSANPNSRGRKWIKRRRALVSIWAEVLTRGETTPTQLAAGDKLADFDGLSKKGYERLFETRASPTAPPYLMDGPAAKPKKLGKARPWHPPHATQGGPQNREIGEMFDLEREGYYGLAAVEHQRGLIPTHASNLLHHHFVKSLTTLREDLLTRLDPLVKDPHVSDAAETLYDDIKFRWWPLRVLHDYISQDVALDWFFDKTNKGQRELLDASRDFKFTRATAIRVVNALQQSKTAPHLSPDAIALLLLREAGSLSWHTDAKISSTAQRAAALTALELPLSPRMRTACLIDLAGSHMNLAEPEPARAALAQAQDLLKAHSDENLENLLAFAASGQTPRVNAQSYGGPTYYEIIGIH